MKWKDEFQTVLLLILALKYLAICQLASSGKDLMEIQIGVA